MSGDSVAIPLTHEQAALYRTNAMFRQAVDAFVQQTAPTFLVGAALMAEKWSTDMEIAMKAVSAGQLRTVEVS